MSGRRTRLAARKGNLTASLAHKSCTCLQVAEAQCLQLRTLNTNARYLSAVLAQYTTKLLSTFPSHLSKLLLCNSGSEANDLALQLARAARPEASHIAVIEGAYHGHVSSMMDCSPYKFWGPQGLGRPSHVHVLPLPDQYRCACFPHGPGCCTAAFQSGAEHRETTEVARCTPNGRVVFLWRAFSAVAIAFSWLCGGAQAYAGVDAVAAACLEGDRRPRQHGVVLQVGPMHGTAMLGVLCANPSHRSVAQNSFSCPAECGGIVHWAPELCRYRRWSRRIACL
jgi:Aminotransferase class-III